MRTGLKVCCLHMQSVRQGITELPDVAAQEDSSAPSAGAIVGIVLAVLAAVVIMLAAALVCIRRRRRRAAAAAKELSSSGKSCEAFATQHKGARSPAPDSDGTVRIPSGSGSELEPALVADSRLAQETPGASAPSSLGFGTARSETPLSSIEPEDPFHAPVAKRSFMSATSQLSAFAAGGATAPASGGRQAAPASAPTHAQRSSSSHLSSACGGSRNGDIDKLFSGSRIPRATGVSRGLPREPPAVPRLQDGSAPEASKPRAAPGHIAWEIEQAEKQFEEHGSKLAKLRRTTAGGAAPPEHGSLALTDQITDPSSFGSGARLPELGAAGGAAPALLPARVACLVQRGQKLYSDGAVPTPATAPDSESSANSISVAFPAPQASNGQACGPPPATSASHPYDESGSGVSAEVTGSYVAADPSLLRLGSFKRCLTPPIKEEPSSGAMSSSGSASSDSLPLPSDVRAGNQDVQRPGSNGARRLDSRLARAASLLQLRFKRKRPTSSGAAQSPPVQEAVRQQGADRSDDEAAAAAAQPSAMWLPPPAGVAYDNAIWAANDSEPQLQDASLASAAQLQCNDSLASCGNNENASRMDNSGSITFRDHAGGFKGAASQLLQRFRRSVNAPDATSSSLVLSPLPSQSANVAGNVISPPGSPPVTYDNAVWSEALADHQVAEGPKVADGAECEAPLPAQPQDEPQAATEARAAASPAEVRQELAAALAALAARQPPAVFAGRYHLEGECIESRHGVIQFAHDAGRGLFQYAIKCASAFLACSSPPLSLQAVKKLPANCLLHTPCPRAFAASTYHWHSKA
jgi:hypothetical protein